jgi:hypothetical protein
MSFQARRRNDRFLAFFLMVIVASSITGCAGKGDISGEVKFKGELLPFGRITFVSEGASKQVVTGVIKDGAYSVAGVPAGPAKVKIETFKPLPADKTPKESDLPKGLSASPPKHVEIPSKYADPAKSGLTYDVTSGSQTKDFDLNP